MDTSKRTRLGVESGEISFLQKVAGVSIGEEFSHLRETQIRAATPRKEPVEGRLLDALWLKCSAYVLLGECPGVEPVGHTGEIIHLGGSRKPRINCRWWLGRKESGLLCSHCCPCDPAPDKQKKMEGRTRVLQTCLL